MFYTQLFRWALVDKVGIKPLEETPHKKRPVDTVAQPPFGNLAKLAETIIHFHG